MAKPKLDAVEPVLGENPTRDDVKKVFAYRLHRLLLSKSWKQSDLARRASVPPDAVSSYIRGLTLPDPLFASRIAVALGTSIAYLLPGMVEDSAAPGEAAAEMQPSKDRPGWYDLRLNISVPLKVAVEALKLVEEYATGAEAASPQRPAQGNA